MLALRVKYSKFVKKEGKTGEMAKVRSEDEMIVG